MKLKTKRLLKDVEVSVLRGFRDYIKQQPQVDRWWVQSRGLDYSIIAKYEKGIITVL